MIRILVVDDHPALRAGLGTVLDAEPGLVHAGASAGDETLWPALDRVRPDLVLLDFHLPQDDGLQLCLRIKQRLLAPKVVLYSAHAGPDLVLGATVAGADALVSKAAPARELFDVVRAVAAGGRPLPPVAPEQRERAAARVRPQDAALLELVLAGVPAREIAARLGLGAGELPERLRRLVADVRPELASGAA